MIISAYRDAQSAKSSISGGLPESLKTNEPSISAGG